ncbi:MAG: L-seryl-tRNA(Sec) selenium transferase [Gemmatimonadales bacterium]|nr:L-seryl-tRNA(Sec) selenium transferase [Gemmatimonadales bacterium]NIN10834.1 L-seryl-tRNA(Sec) selenium transferase [Gemmatimonadales bacterium]NIN49477.1 L-seryl-tRNA(Sec) selenium transferase [Gemmatimonadales bacterium]NIP06941.1 L-seryl-tRNA(Sec) selenium transferase [Gemmatimonadales bacterium]NIR01617.1 L-seryl-tRNA(Sec) selenium transferase [Gemmatimonadales bacterium]
MNDRRRSLPAVSTLLEQAVDAGLTTRAPRSVVVDAIRATLQQARQRSGEPPPEGWLAAVEQRVIEQSRRSLRRVVNATGVILHTNLGRAPLARAARQAVDAALGYSALEFDVAAGTRGSRQAHTRSLLQQLTGAEDALVVVNAAAAVFLVLNTLAGGGETLVSRGELVEIGGRFRIPEILSKSGSILVEVGTTNRTRLRDYELAISPRTRLILKVHRSNFQLTGFVTEASTAELVALGRVRGIPVVHDVGSGLLISLEEYGLGGEPLVQHSVVAGATVVFSGDKLLGGPQAGIIVGPRDVVSRAGGNPMARALRPDKTTLAALEATLALYRDPERALAEIPALTMLTAEPRALKRRARRLARRIPGAHTAPGTSAVGGGAFPGCELPTTLVTVAVESCEAFVGALRQHDPPVIARTSEDRVVFDVRTLGDDEVAVVAEAVRQAREKA